MQIPTSIIWLDEGGYILRYALRGENGPVPADMGLLSRDADTLEIALKEIAAPDRLLWQESGIQDPGEVSVEEEGEG